MTLGDFEILPGVVIDTADPLNLYRVKACAPGLFDLETMEQDDLLWINPFMMMGNQSMAKLEINAKIWILHNKNNYFEYWYIPMFETNANMPQVADVNSDVMMARSVGGSLVQFYYAPEEGYKLCIGENSILLKSNGDFNVFANGSVIDVNSNGIQLVKAGEEEKFHAAKAEKIIEALGRFCGDMQQISMLMAANPYTASLSKQFNTAAVTLYNQLDSFKSTFVTIS